MKHKWYDVIVALAEGKAVERNVNGRGWETFDVELHLSPINTQDNIEWRIKKEPVIEVKYFRKVIGTSANIYEEIKAIFPEHWDLKITYQDGKAVKAELPSET